MNTPESETEIEIAAEADTVQDDHHHHDNDAKSGDNGSEAGSDQSAGTELLNTAAARLKFNSRPGEDMPQYVYVSRHNAQNVSFLFVLNSTF